MSAIDGREYFFTILFVTLVDLIKRVHFAEHFPIFN